MKLLRDSIDSKIRLAHILAGGSLERLEQWLLNVSDEFLDLTLERAFSADTLSFVSGLEYKER
jgi:hypothetical protein